MPIDETVRKYQTCGETPTHKTKVVEIDPKRSVSVQFNDVKKMELSHGECAGCNY